MPGRDPVETEGLELLDKLNPTNVYFGKFTSRSGLKFNITRRVKLATISRGWTYSESKREKRGIRVHEECHSGVGPSASRFYGWEMTIAFRKINICGAEQGFAASQGTPS